MPDDLDSPRFRFNLRHVFIAVTGLCVVLAASVRAVKHRYDIDAAVAIIASLLLTLGTITLCVLRWRRPCLARSSVVWIPLACLFAGPILSLGYMAFWLSPEYYSMLLLPMLEFGTRIGVAVAAVFMTALFVTAGLEKATADIEDFNKGIVILLCLFCSPAIVALAAVAMAWFLGW